MIRDNSKTRASVSPNKNTPEDSGPHLEHISKSHKKTYNRVGTEVTPPHSYTITLDTDENDHDAIHYAVKHKRYFAAHFLRDGFQRKSTDDELCLQAARIGIELF